MKKRWIAGASLLTFLLLTQCRTGGVIIPETPLNVSETRKVITTVIGKPRSVSENGRELYSVYYDRKNKPIEHMELAKERFYTVITILGDRRPYDVQVEVVLEQRDEEGHFQMVDKRDQMAQPIAQKLKKALNESLDSRNVIDDFRSF